MSATYKATQVTKPGEFEAVMKPLVDPGPGQVRIRVEARFRNVRREISKSRRN